MKTFTLYVILAMIFSVAVGSAQTDVTLDNVTNVQDDSLLMAGELHTFSIRLRNIGSGVNYNFANGFRLFSDDGAQWSYPVRDTTIKVIIPGVLEETIIDSISVAGRETWEPYFPVKFGTLYFSPDGMDADTLAYFGAGDATYFGIVQGHDTVRFEIPIQSRPEDRGKHICIDSSWYPPGGTWKWAPLDLAYPQIAPGWSGLQCFKIYDPNAPSSLELDKTHLNFSAIEGGSNPAAQTFTVSSDNEPLAFSLYEDASWLLKSPSSGTTPQEVSVTVNITGLTQGSYQDSVQVFSATAGNSPLYVHVSLDIGPAPPEIAVNQGAFFFNAIAGEANPDPQTLVITNSGASTLEWTVTNSESWLELSPAAGTDSGDVTLAVDIVGLAYGNYFDTIVVSDPAAANSPVAIPVTLTVGSDLPIIVVDVPPMYILPLGGAPDFEISFGVLNSGGGTMNFRIEEDHSEIQSVDPETGTVPDTVTLQIKVSPGEGDELDFTVWVFSDEAINSPLEVALRLRFATDPAVLNLSTDTVVLDVYECSQGLENLLPCVTVEVTNLGGDDPVQITLEYESDLFTIPPDLLTAPALFDVCAKKPLTGTGIFWDTIVVSAIRAINSPETLIVRYNVVPADETPELVLQNAYDLLFYKRDSGPLSVTGPIIANLHGGCLDWFVDEDIPWLDPLDSSGGVPHLLSYLVEPTGMNNGWYHDTLSIVAPAAANSPQTATIDLFIWNLRGDVNADGLIDIGDVTYLIAYLYIDGPEPLPVREMGNVNCDRLHRVDIGDLTELIYYLYVDRVPPCDDDLF